MDTERVRQGDHLVHGRVRDGAVPDPLHYLFGKGAETHAGYRSIRVGLARPLVSYCLKEVVDPVGEITMMTVRSLDPDHPIEVTGFLEP
jgi:hypothetical protein